MVTKDFSRIQSKCSNCFLSTGLQHAVCQTCRVMLYYVLYNFPLYLLSFICYQLSKFNQVLGLSCLNLRFKIAPIEIIQGVKQGDLAGRPFNCLSQAYPETGKCMVKVRAYRTFNPKCSILLNKGFMIFISCSFNCRNNSIEMVVIVLIQIVL